MLGLLLLWLCDSKCYSLAS